MATIEQIRKRKKLLEMKNKALRQRNAAKRALFEARKEKERLRQEVKTLRNPRTVAFQQNLKRGLMSGGKGIMNYLDQVTRPVPVRTPIKKRRRR